MARHSDGATVAIEVRFDAGEARLRVEDPGPCRPVAAGAGSGLTALARRLEAAEGRLRAGPTAAGGFVLEARVPAGGAEAPG